MVFCNFLEINAQTKKVVGVKVVPFWVLYSCVKFRRLKMGEPVYSELFTNVMKLFKIRKYSTTAYHPQSNGALERSHQGLVDYIKHYTEQYKTTWDKWIEFAIFSYNTIPHTVTKFIPYELVFGRKSNLPSLLTNCNDPIYTFEDYLTELKTKLQHSFNIARDRVLDYKERNNTYYDKKAKPQ